MAGNRLPDAEVFQNTDQSEDNAACRQDEEEDQLSTFPGRTKQSIHGTGLRSEPGQVGNLHRLGISPEEPQEQRHQDNRQKDTDDQNPGRD